MLVGRKIIQGADRVVAGGNGAGVEVLARLASSAFRACTGWAAQTAASAASSAADGDAETQGNSDHEAECCSIAPSLPGRRI